MNPWDSQTIRVYAADGVFPTLSSNSGGGQNRQSVCIPCYPRVAHSLTARHDGSPQPDKANGANIVVQAAGFKAGNGPKAHGIGYEEEIAPTLLAAPSGMNQAPSVVVKTYDARGNGDGDTVNTLTGDPMNTLTSADRHAVAYVQTYQKVTGSLMANSHPGSYTGQDAFSDMLVAGPEQICVFDKEVYNSGKSSNGGHYVSEHGPAPTLRGTGHPPGVCIRYIVRRLTPTECARLQGFADRWGWIDEKDSLTAEEYQFWLDVRNTHAAINGKPYKYYTKERMLKWYNKLHTDSAEYKMWGNGIALPPAIYCMQGFSDALNRERS